MRRDPFYRSDGHAPGKSLLPLLLERREVLVRERVGQILKSTGQPLLLGFLFFDRQCEYWRGVARAPVQSDFGDAVEEGVELIELLLRDRVVFVRVATRAAHRQPQPGRGGRLDSVNDVLVQVLFGYRAALEIDHVVAIESGGDLLILSGFWEQIARELFDRELVEAFVLVEGADHPVAPRPNVAVAVDVVAMRVGVARQVEPNHGHPLAVMRRLEQPVNYLLVSAS